MFKRNFFRKNIRQPLAALLQEGLTPEKLACAMALGLTVGMFPCPWGATILCAALAFLLKINHVAIQVANYLAWPFQITFFIPFFWAGQKLFPIGEPFFIENLTFSSFQQPIDSLQMLLIADSKAVAAWLLLSPLIYLLIYFPALTIFIRRRRMQPVNSCQEIPNS